MSAIHMINEETGIIVGGNGEIWRRTDTTMLQFHQFHLLLEMELMVLEMLSITVSLDEPVFVTGQLLSYYLKQVLMMHW